MNNIQYRILAILFLGLMFFSSCEDEAQNQKPSTILKLEFPEHSYHTEKGEGPYTFQMPDEWTLIPVRTFDGDFCQEKIDLATHLYKYPSESEMQGIIDLRYNRVPDKRYIEDLIFDSFKLVDKEQTFAEAGSREYWEIIDKKNNIYGKIIESRGNGVASPLQFFFTDSVSNYVHGRVIIKYDDYKKAEQSIKHIKSGVLEMINTFEWNQD